MGAYTSKSLSFKASKAAAAASKTKKKQGCLRSELDDLVTTIETSAEMRMTLNVTDEGGVKCIMSVEEDDDGGYVEHQQNIKTDPDTLVCVEVQHNSTDASLVSTSVHPPSAQAPPSPPSPSPTAPLDSDEIDVSGQTSEVAAATQQAASSPQVAETVTEKSESDKSDKSCVQKPKRRHGYMWAYNSPHVVAKRNALLTVLTKHMITMAYANPTLRGVQTRRQKSIVMSEFLENAYDVSVASCLRHMVNTGRLSLAAIDELQTAYASLVDALASSQPTGKDRERLQCLTFDSDDKNDMDDTRDGEASISMDEVYYFVPRWGGYWTMSSDKMQSLLSKLKTVYF